MVCISSFSYYFQQPYLVNTFSESRLEPTGSINWAKSQLPNRDQTEEPNIGDIETIRGLNSCCYKGVRQRSWGKWVSEIRNPKKKTRIWLGSFPTPEMAARAYDAAALYIKGDMASLNFPELASSIPHPVSISCKDIQAAAAGAAAELCPPNQLAKTNENKRRRKDGKGKTSEAPYTNVFAPTDTMEKDFFAESVDGPIEHKEPPYLVDEDVIFNLPNILIDMAQGMLLPPPLPPPSPRSEEVDIGFEGTSFLWNF